MRISMALASAALTCGALLVSTAASADPLSASTNYLAEYGDGSTVPASDSTSDTSMAFTSVWEDHGHGYGASNINGILGAEASAGRVVSGGGGEPAAMSFGVLSLDVDGPGTDEPGAVPAQVTVWSEGRWETTVTNNHDTALDYSFIFHVYGPTLQTAFDSGQANVALSIFSDTQPDLYTADASLAGTVFYADPQFGSYDYDSSINNYRFNSFDAAVSLGTIEAGQSFTLTYIMSAYAFATDLDNGSYAYIGDPFNFGYGPEYQMITTASPTPGIPEPATWALLIAGFGLVGLSARRRRMLEA